MQKRYHIGWFKTFEDALAAKKQEKEAKEDGIFQIRRKQRGFELVERLHSKEAQHVQEHFERKTRSTRKRSKRKVSFNMG